MSDPNLTSTTATVGLSIGEVAQQTGIPIETLRFYDRSGLLGPGHPAATGSSMTCPSACSTS
jgi:hypothetical protein